MERTVAVFSPSNEPYLGRELLLHFDRTISICLKENSRIAPLTHKMSLSEHQSMACQVIPQAISIALSIRELVRQGYLFGAHVLIRPLVERTAILIYLHDQPSEIDRWTRGWVHGDAPSLGRMLEVLQHSAQGGVSVPGHELTSSMNSLLHGRLDSAPWSAVKESEEDLGHAPSKILNRPELCDAVCAQAVPWLASIVGMMGAYFPEPTQA